MSPLARYIRDPHGNSAAEFALILPGMLFLIFGTLNLCLVTYASVNLHSAVEQAARYASTYAAANNGSDAGSTAVKAFAAGHYIGPGISASFAYSSAGVCGVTGGASSGHVVTGTGSYKVNYGAGVVTVPLSATACFP